MPKSQGAEPDTDMLAVYGNRQKLDNAMRQIQPTAKTAGKYWGLRPNSSAEEQIANISGFEGSLPKGTGILDTPEGQKILSNQQLKDYYFTQSSVPFGGVWEGQSTGNNDSLLNKFRSGLLKFGINTVNRK